MREQYDGWQKASHHARATCNDCHVPQDALGKYVTKAKHGWRHSKAFTLQDFHEPIRIRPEDLAIVNDNCARCHAGTVRCSLITPSRRRTSTPSPRMRIGVCCKKA